ncbi:MAG TPA: DUF5916 domain-containing protein, partial [Saprospiraceae bacterium]|nr:DUF5916 domain-containing protein [Saprospiraceae bacterium]
GYELNMTHNYRINQKFSISWSLSAQPKINNIGFAGRDDESSIFARRNISTFINTLGFKFSFTNRMGLTTRIRHYHSRVFNKQYYNITENGLLIPNTEQAFSFDKAADFFNIDMVYSWQFAQGSFINVVWKNAIVRQRANAEGTYFSNLEDLLKGDQNNNLSLKVIYFLDYLQMKRK